jgi:hypothetical protein
MAYYDSSSEEEYDSDDSGYSATDRSSDESSSEEEYFSFASRPIAPKRELMRQPVKVSKPKPKQTKPKLEKTSIKPKEYQEVFTCKYSHCTEVLPSKISKEKHEVGHAIPELPIYTCDWCKVNIINRDEYLCHLIGKDHKETVKRIQKCFI